MHKELILQSIKDALSIKQQLLVDQDIHKTIEAVASLITATFEAGGGVYLCGNGGSAADAQHIAGELSGRFRKERKALRCEALHVNTSFITAVGNDYGFDFIYERAVEAFCKPNDVLIALSTSGNSTNIIKAIDKANKMKVHVIGLTGSTNGEMNDKCTHLFQIPSKDTPRIQEAHILIGHILCELVEAQMFD